MISTAMHKTKSRKPCGIARAGLPGKKSKRSARKRPSLPSSPFVHINALSSVQLPSLLTNRQLAGFYHPAKKLVSLIETGDQRILAVDGPTIGEVCWNHLHEHERRELVLAITQLKKALT